MRGQPLDHVDRIAAPGIQGVSAGPPTTYDPQRCPFWPAKLRQAGYGTALVGKWHLGEDVGQGRDWDHSVVWIQPPGLGPSKDAYQNPSLRIDGQSAQPGTGYSTDLYTQYAVEYLHRVHDRPWFLWLSYNAPHGPLQPHPRHQERYRDAPAHIPLMSTPVARYMYPDPAAYAEIVRNLPWLVCAVNEGVGEIRKAGRKPGNSTTRSSSSRPTTAMRLGRTEFRGSWPPPTLTCGSPDCAYPAAVRAGGVCRHPVSLVDVPPTCLALAGQPQPWAMHGHDLRPLLTDPQAAWPHPVLLENFYVQFGSQTNGGCTTGGTLNGIAWWLSLIDASVKTSARWCRT